MCLIILEIFLIKLKRKQNWKFELLSLCVKHNGQRNMISIFFFPRFAFKNPVFQNKKWWMTNLSSRSYLNVTAHKNANVIGDKNESP